MKISTTKINIGKQIYLDYGKCGFIKHIYSFIHDANILFDTNEKNQKERAIRLKFSNFLNNTISIIYNTNNFSYLNNKSNYFNKISKTPITKYIEYYFKTETGFSIFNNNVTSKHLNRINISEIIKITQQLDFNKTDIWTQIYKYTREPKIIMDRMSKKKELDIVTNEYLASLVHFNNKNYPIISKQLKYIKLLNLRLSNIMKNDEKIRNCYNYKLFKLFVTSYFAKNKNCFTTTKNNKIRKNYKYWKNLLIKNENEKEKKKEKTNTKIPLIIRENSFTEEEINKKCSKSAINLFKILQKWEKVILPIDKSIKVSNFPRTTKEIILVALPILFLKPRVCVSPRVGYCGFTINQRVYIKYQGQEYAGTIKAINTTGAVSRTFRIKCDCDCNNTSTWGGIQHIRPI